MKITERRGRDKEDIKLLILNAAKKLFIERGIEFTTIRNIADEIHYSVGTVYVYFSDKNAILYEIMQTGFIELRHYLEDSLIVNDPYEQLGCLADGYIKFALENNELYDLMFIMSAPMQFIKQYKNGEWNEGRETFHFLEIVVERCINAGYFNHKNLKELSLIFWGLVHGISSLYIRKRIDVLDTDEVEATIKSSIHTFLQMIKAEEKSD